MVLGILMLFSIFYYTAGELKTISISPGAIHLFLDFDGSEVVDRNRVVVVLYIGFLM
jgi:hypothetical protein